jgi:hypothetical protein
MDRLHDLLIELGFRADPIEWAFLQDDDGLWKWEFGKSGKVMRRSGERFRTREHCMRDAVENGFCKFFSPRKITPRTECTARVSGVAESTKN